MIAAPGLFCSCDPVALDKGLMGQDARSWACVPRSWPNREVGSSGAPAMALSFDSAILL